MTPLEVAKNYQAGLEACPELVHAGDPILRRRIGGGVAAEDEADEIFALLKDVLGRFRAATGFGRGLAATQIGIPARAFVTFLNDEWRLWLNPSVLGASAVRTLYRESCLSCGPISVDVARPSEIEAFWTDSELYRCKGGNQQLAEKLADGIGRDRITLRMPVTRVHTSRSGRVSITPCRSVSRLALTDGCR